MCFVVNIQFGIKCNNNNIKVIIPLIELMCKNNFVL